MKTREPLSIYMLIITTLVFLFLFIYGANNYWAVIMYIVIYAVLFYVIFCRHACRVYVEGGRMIVKYMLFEKRIVVDLDKINKVDYTRGFYGWTGYKSKSMITQTCYDTIYFYDEKELLKTININTRMFGFNEIINHLRGRGIRINEDYWL